MLKKIFISTVISAALTGCGGGENEAGSPVSPPVSVKPTPTQVTVKVIDGYLENAFVCVDRNLNRFCEKDEYLQEKTNKLGEVVLDKQDGKYPLIAEVKRGISIDANTGFASHSYQMIAGPGSEQITPFTTILELNNLSKDAVAASLNLDVNVVFSDYAQSNSTNAQTVSLIARSITSHMHKLEENEADKLFGIAIEISNFVSKNNITNPSSVIVVKNTNGYELASTDATMKGILTARSEWTFANLDRTTFLAENFRIARFGVSKVEFYNEWDNRTGEENISYSIDGVMNTSGKLYREKFVYVSDELLIGQADGNEVDLNLWLPGFKGVKQIGWIPMQFPSERFTNGETWYHIMDDGKDLTLSTMTFNSNGSVVINIQPSDEKIIGSYKHLYNFRNQIQIQFGIESPFVIEGWHGNNEVLLVRHANRNTFALFTQDKELAYSIVGK